MSEHWQPIPSFPGYEASTEGRIRSVDRYTVNALGHRRFLKGRTRAQTLTGKGVLARYRVWIKGRVYGVHVLVAEAFYGPCPDGLFVLHDNGDPSDNRPQNLYYGTQSENQLDAVRHGTHNNARKTHCPNNHPYDTHDGWSRRCSICRLEKERERKGLDITGPSRRVKTHCKNNHEFTPENTRINSANGQRVCKTCHRERARARRQLHP